MSPYPAKVTRELIVHRARGMIENDGVEALSLGKLAADLGIAAPSLYNHFKNKTALLQAVNVETARALVAALTAGMQQQAADEAAGAHEQLMGMAAAYRAFVRENPASYDLAFTNTIPDLHLDSQLAEALAQPLQAIMAAHVGEARSLAALRGAWALLHGFATLEITGQFRRGGDLDAAFTQVFAAYLDGWR
jgi:AcrR family transcriptional regulator